MDGLVWIVLMSGSGGFGHSVWEVNTLVDSEGVAAAWFDQHNCEAAIVRPDHYVYCGLRKLSQAADACRDLRERLKGTALSAG